MSIAVPNLFPKYNSPLRMAIIGESPGLDEVRNGRPFIGSSGRFLAALLSRAGISIDACFLGNVCQYNPPGNDINAFAWNGDEIQEGLYKLETDLKQFKPNVCVLLGNIPLKAAKNPHVIEKRASFSVSNWRGSLFIGEQASGFNGLKCLASYHPAYCLRCYDDTPMLQLDLRKAVREASTPLLTLPKRNFYVGLSIPELISKLQGIRQARTPVAIDIEGGIDSMSCISFATSPSEAFIVPFYDKQGRYVSTAEVWRETALTLEDPYVPKILQNSLYDRFVLHHSYGIRVMGVTHDTMLRHWELYSELEKSLGVQASIYTDEPFYKSDRKSDDDQTFYEYCCRDSAVTLEISDKLESFIGGSSRTHYEFNMGMLNPILYMELRGIRYDEQRASDRRAELQRKQHECQAHLNALTSHCFSWQSLKEIQDYANSIFLTKKGDRPRKEYEASILRFSDLIKSSNPGLATIGELEDLCEVSLNINSKKQFQAYVYDTLKLPVQMSNVRGKEPHPTTDYEALLNLSRWCTQNKHDLGFKVCQAAIELRALSTRAGMLSISADRDGRMRCGYNPVGSNTGRVTCYESPTGSGYNLQTIPNYTKEAEAPGGVLGDRDLFLADDGYYIFQCDLAGADGWTVAAYSAMLGDSGMLDDFNAGIKPYARIALKIEGRPEAEWKDRANLAAFLKEYKLEPIPKLMSKRVLHGGDYLEGGLAISRNILKDSEGKVYMSPRDGDGLKQWMLSFYWGIPKWHNWVAARLRERPVLTAASGQVRQFFGRPDDILTKAVAFEPQANTTYATNLATFRLWSDNENRIDGPHPTPTMGNGLQASRLLETLPHSRPRTHLRIEPLHTVHDALIGQFRKEDTAWAMAKIKQWFNNPLQIAGQQIIIPFDGHYGPSWGQQDVGTI